MFNVPMQGRRFSEGPHPYCPLTLCRAFWKDDPRPNMPPPTARVGGNVRSHHVPPAGVKGGPPLHGTGHVLRFAIIPRIAQPMPLRV